MLLLEFFDAAPEGYQDLDKDNSQPKWGTARKTKLTLGMINKIRRMKDVQSFEKAKDLKKIRHQYQPPAPAGGL
jgi:hypothetical protein